MNPDVKEKWVAKLRTGDLPQTRGALHRTEPEEVDGETIPAGFCCLGVLCEIAVEEGVATRDGETWDGRVRYRSAVEHDSSSAGYLTDEIAKWAGIEFNGQFLTEDNEVAYLANLNDTGTSFEEIADLIERYL